MSIDDPDLLGQRPARPHLLNIESNLDWFANILKFDSGEGICDTSIPNVAWSPTILGSFSLVVPRKDIR